MSVPNWILKNLRHFDMFFLLFWLLKCHFSFAKKTLEANQFVLSRAFVWVPICVLQNLRHFDMFLSYLVVKTSFFICQKNAWGKSICFVKSFNLSTYLRFAKFEAFWHVFDFESAKCVSESTFPSSLCRSTATWIRSKRSLRFSSENAFFLVRSI